MKKSAVLSLLVFGIILLLSPVFAPIAFSQPPHPTTESAQHGRPRGRPLFSWPIREPKQVVQLCAEHLATIPPFDRPRVRYFDLSAVPPEHMSAATAALMFGINSLHVMPMVTHPQIVPNSDHRIFWIDLAWYKWDPQAWEDMTREDPYFREPLIPSNDPALNYLRAQTGSIGAVVRGDWFIVYSFDNTKFLGKNSNKADQAFYYTFVFGYVEKEVEEKVKVRKKKVVQEKRIQTVTDGIRRWNQEVVVPVEKEVEEEEVRKVKKKVPNAPATAADFEKFWKVDFELLKDFPIDVGAMVDEGKSGVSFHNRILWRIRTSMGVYWRTFDVFRSVRDQDFIENPFPFEIDAGEHIVQDAKGAQFYMLSDGKGNRVEFADPRLVSSASVGHPAVITSKSCVVCHSTGILNFRNEHTVMKQIGLKVYGLGVERAERFRQFFLNPKMDELVAEDQRTYANFIKECNGLTTTQNSRFFDSVVRWYESPVNLKQAAAEIGISENDLSTALLVGIGTEQDPKGTTKGRLAAMALGHAAVPRDSWERGLYQEAFLLLLEHRKFRKINK